MLTKGMMEMLKTTLGIDPVEIQKTVAQMGQIIVALHNSQARTEKMVRALYDEKYPDADPAGIRIAPVTGSNGAGDPPPA